MRRSLCYGLVVVLALAAAPLVMGAGTTSAQRSQALEQGILREVNRVRAERGLHSLTISRGLNAAATFQSRALLTHGVFDHSSAAGGAFGDRLHRYYPVAGARAWSVGENLLWSSAGIDAGGVVKRWLDSPGHRRIMLGASWREFGVGAFAAPSAPGVYASAGAVVVVTMDFGSRTAS